MFFEEVILILKWVLVLGWTIGAVVIMNPAVPFLKPFKKIKADAEAFFFKTGFLGFWGIFCRIGDWAKDIKITIKTNHSDEAYYIIRDRHIIPFFKLYTDNTSVLQVHHLLRTEYNKIIMNNLYHRAKKFYEGKGLKLIGFKIEIVGIKNASDRDYPHDINEPKFNWYEVLMEWKDGQPLPAQDEKL
ncbi:hypothetical protein EBU71_11085 [bacterium]|nr:hypothetical protein [Candidatus Elulimicrobium humile]